MNGSVRTPRSRAGPSIKPTATLPSRRERTTSLVLPVWRENWILGYSLWKAPSKRGNTYCAIVVEAPNASSPETLPSLQPSSRSASEDRLASWFAYPNKTEPCRVSVILPPVRSNRRIPRSFSSALICKVTAGWVRKSCSAAFRKFSCSATVRNTLRRKFSKCAIGRLCRIISYWLIIGKQEITGLLSCLPTTQQQTGDSVISRAVEFFHQPRCYAPLRGGTILCILQLLLPGAFSMTPTNSTRSGICAYFYCLFFLSS